MHNFPSGNELQSPCQLVSYFHGLSFRNWSSFWDHVFQVAVGAELEDHDDIVLSEETIVYFSGEQTVWIDYLGKLLQNTYFLFCF